MEMGVVYGCGGEKTTLGSAPGRKGGGGGGGLVARVGCCSPWC